MASITVGDKIVDRYSPIRENILWEDMVNSYGKITCKYCGEKRLKIYFFPSCLEKNWKICKYCYNSRYGERVKKWQNGNRDKLNAASRKWQNNNPEKKRAHDLVYNLIKRGLLKREPCIICEDKKSEAHHEDYDNYEEVVWLCRKHHREIKHILRGT